MESRNFFTPIVAASLILGSAAAQCALNASIKITGSKQGVFKSTSAKHPGASDVTVIDAGFSLISPRDAASGLPTGKRMHKPFSITRETDSASPNFFEAFSNGELLPAVRITVYAVVGGKEVVDYTIDLTSAHISSAAHKTTKPASDAIAFTYQKITVTWASTGKTFTDNWSDAK